MRSASRIVPTFAFGMLMGLSGCDPDAGPLPIVAAVPSARGDRASGPTASKKMKITIGKQTFTATLDDNPATARLRSMLPLRLDMGDLNSNEKHVHLPAALPTDGKNPGAIRNGDLMLWGSDTLVLFYKGFPTPYGYTRLGRVDDPEGLAAAVGSGSVTVTFDVDR